MKLGEYYFGMISEVYPPTDIRNSGKSQYEYQVIMTGGGYASIPVRCIRKDEFGSRDDFDDLIMQVSDKVMIKFPRGDRSLGVITESTRNYIAPQNEAMGRHWRRRFNKVVQLIDKNFNYSVTSDAGPNLQVNTNKIILDDASGESITIDKAAKTITIAANTFTVNVQGNATFQITGDANVNAANANITASGNAVIKGGQVQLNGSSGMVLTTVTDPIVDSIYGEPTMGVNTVTAG